MKLAPQTLQLPTPKFCPLTNIEVTTILGLILSDVNVRCEGVHYLEYIYTRCASDRNVIAYSFKLWDF